MFANTKVKKYNQRRSVFTWSNQKGGGFITTLKSGYKAVREPPRFQGENHIILKVGDEFKRAEFAGPGTNIVEREKLKIRPLTATDKTAEMHDINYSLAENEDDVRKADKRMVNKMNDIKANKQDSNFNIIQGKYGIVAKMALEDIGVPKTAFTTFGREGMSTKDLRLLKQRKDELEQEGYGDYEEFDEDNCKPCEKMLRTLIKYKSKNAPISVKKRYRKGKKFEKEFKNAEIPDNVKRAMALLKF